MVGCSDPWPEIAEKYETMNHPFFDKVQYGWRWNEDQCVVYLKSGEKAPVRCIDLSHMED